MSYDFIAYLAAIFLLGSTPIRRRSYAHLGRLIGVQLWFWYGVIIGNAPIIITNIIATIIELYSAHKYEDQGA
jgi:hypothetical protein